MPFLKSKKLIVVHNGNFHPDDVFCVALLSIIHNGGIKVIRTRDEGIISKADYVMDVGGEYNPDKDRFDHHQPGGAGMRDNKIFYSAFGILWKKYGEKACGSKEVADTLDKKLVQVIDADDNGFNLYKTDIENVYPFMLTDLIYSMRPTWKESHLEIDKIFLKAVDFAKEILLRQIKIAKDGIEVTKVIQDLYKNSSDKRLIIVEDPKVSRYDIWDALEDFSEPLFIIYEGEGSWAAVAMRKSRSDSANRKDFPKNWAGLRDGELAKVSGVEDAIFCHNGLFLSVARSKEGAIKMANIAINS
ncbi:MAG: MYG1 family protein [bacterium]